MSNGNLSEPTWGHCVYGMSIWRVSEYHSGDGVRVVSFGESVRLIQGEHWCDGLCLQSGIQWARWGAVCGMLAGAVQSKQRLIGVRAVQRWDVPEHQCGNGMRDMPVGELVQLAEGELGSRGLPLQCGV